MGRTSNPIANAKLEITKDFKKDEKMEIKKESNKFYLFDASKRLKPKPRVKIKLKMQIEPKNPITKFQRGIGRTSSTNKVFLSISR